MEARNRITRALMPIGLVAASLFIAGPAAAATPSTCAGHVPTIVGTYGDDVIVGTNGNDIIDGSGGNDEIYGLDGDDIICGNNGEDVIYGGKGNDRLFGGSAIDTIYGETGNDELRGNTGRDRLYGGPQADVIYGGMHADKLFGDDGDDLLLGGHDRDQLNGGLGDDTLYGGNGNDDLRGDEGNDIIVGDEGADSARGGADFDRCEVDDSVECEDDLNDAPSAADDAFFTSEDHVLVGNLFADNGSGIDDDPNADPIRISAIDGVPIDGDAEVLLASGATVTVHADGSFSYVAGISHDGLADGIDVQDGFAYTVADPRGETDEATVAVVVGGANDAPIANDDEEGTDEDTGVDVDVLANDSDPEEQELSIVSVDTSGIEGSVTVNPDNTLRYTPPAAFDALTEGDEVEEEFSYIVSDGFGGTTAAQVTVYVEGVNDAPDANDDAAATDEDSSVIIDVLSNDSDIDGYDELSIDLETAPAHGTAVVTGAGTFEYTPDANWNGVDSFTYEVDDNTGNRSIATVTVTVGAVNDAPVAASDLAEADAGAMVIILVLANDTDVDGDALQVTIIHGPDNGTVVVLSNGALAYTSNAGFSGIDELTYLVTDAGDLTDTATVSITVSN